MHVQSVQKYCFSALSNMQICGVFVWRRRHGCLNSLWSVLQLCGRREHTMTHFQFCFLMSQALVNSRIVRTHFSSIMSLDNWKMIAETRSHIFRWRSRFRRRRVCLSSLMTGTATTTPQIKNLIGRASENKRAARAARIYEQVRAILCKTHNNVKLPHLQFWWQLEHNTSNL